MFMFIHVLQVTMKAEPETREAISRKRQNTEVNPRHRGTAAERSNEKQQGTVTRIRRLMPSLLRSLVLLAGAGSALAFAPTPLRPCRACGISARPVSMDIEVSDVARLRSSLGSTGEHAIENASRGRGATRGRRIGCRDALQR
jgi:hypothetical protein